MNKDIDRKDALIKRYKENLTRWQQTLKPNSTPSTAGPSLPGFAPIQRQQQQQKSSAMET